MRRLSLLVILCGCGNGSSSTRDDASVETGKDAQAATETNVVGMLGGAGFNLRYAAVKWETATDPRNWVCVANIPVSYADCEASGGANRIMFLGPFLRDQSGDPYWGIVQTWLYRVGSGALSENAKTGTLEVLSADAANGTLRLVMNVDFGESQPTSGSVVLAQ